MDRSESEQQENTGITKHEYASHLTSGRWTRRTHGSLFSCRQVEGSEDASDWQQEQILSQSFTHRCQVVFKPLNQRQ
jgi:hypothetical protein